VFESLNDKRLDLSSADLIKVQVFAKLADLRHSDREELLLKQRWDEISDRLSSTKGSENVRFLRAYFFTLKGHVSKADLVESYKAYIDENCKKAKDLIAFVGDISDACTNYRNIIESKVPKHSYLSSMLIGFKSLGMSQHIPLFLAALNRKANSTTILKLVKIVDFLAIRVFATTGLTANNFEKDFATWAMLLASGANQNKVIKKMKSSIRENKKIISFSDQAFQQLFCSANFNQSQRRYILQGIERFISKDGAEKLFAENDELHLEHILPKASDTKCWRDAIKSADIRSHYLNNLGNITLLYKTENVGIKNKCFPDKVKVYAKSKMRVTQLISKSKIKAWDEKAIKARLVELSETGIKVWSLPK
jgi:hypothetical protein